MRMRMRMMNFGCALFRFHREVLSISASEFEAGAGVTAAS